MTTTLMFVFIISIIQNLITKLFKTDLKLLFLFINFILSISYLSYLEVNIETRSFLLLFFVSMTIIQAIIMNKVGEKNNNNISNIDNSEFNN